MSRRAVRALGGGRYWAPATAALLGLLAWLVLAVVIAFVTLD